MIVTDKEQAEHDNAVCCYVCECKFSLKVKSKSKVRDHDHLTGKYRGPACNSCNLKMKVPRFIPVLFHNLTGYDSHMFIKKLGCSKHNIKVIPKTDEKYISFSKYLGNERYGLEVRFLDSYGFMSYPLDDLAKFLDPSKFKSVVKNFGEDTVNNVFLKRDKDDGKIKMRKGVYPYEYMTGPNKLSETSLPPKSAFYSRLKNSGITDEDYSYAQEVWRETGCKTMRDYTEIYQELDVMILANVFENVRDMCLEHYDLDPAWYYTSPGLFWDAALKKSEVKLDLMTDATMYKFIKTCIRGGVSMISHRYAKANNKYMGEDYDLNKPSSYIQNLDAGSLYPSVMVRPLPVSEYEWVDDEQDLENWDQLCGGDDGVGMFLCVDLEYPKELHDDHNDYPMAPDKMEVDGVTKLIPNLCDKTEYGIHYEALRACLKYGLKLKKIHYAVRFRERPWLKEYIDMNIELRASAKFKFEGEFFKHAGNAVFGKTMENVRNRVDVRLVTREEQLLKLSRKPTFERVEHFDKSLVAVHMLKGRVLLNRPIAIGDAVLDLSKVSMYEFHYGYIRPKYGDDARLLMTDTDSMMYHIHTEDFYEDISLDVHELFDTSNYPKAHPSGVEVGVNRRVPGKFKDECGGLLIDEFIGLRPKNYSYKMYGSGEEVKKCKGITKYIVKGNITHEDYKHCLETGDKHIRRMTIIRSEGHEMYTQDVNKIALSRDDNKRMIMSDGISTKAYGYYG